MMMAVRRSEHFRPLPCDCISMNKTKTDQRSIYHGIYRYIDIDIIHLLPLLCIYMYTTITTRAVFLAPDLKTRGHEALARNFVFIRALEAVMIEHVCVDRRGAIIARITTESIMIFVRSEL
jgi:hypothetical protein